MKIAVVMPVVISAQRLLELTQEAVQSLKSRHSLTLYIICNRLTICSPEALRAGLQARFSGEIVLEYEPGLERSVAASWNAGCALASAQGSDYIALVGNDTRLQDDCMDKLADFAERGEADLCSGYGYNKGPRIDAGSSIDGCRFSCAFFGPQILSKYGHFDLNYWPAYFEDNDYYARVVLGGGKCRICGGAQFFHHGSMTVHHDKAAAQKVRARFEKNRQYFAKKWGVRKPEDHEKGVLERYFRHPFNDPSKPLSWFPIPGANSNP